MCLILTVIALINLFYLFPCFLPDIANKRVSLEAAFATADIVYLENPSLESIPPRMSRIALADQSRAKDSPFAWFQRSLL